jgi:predicted ester cyclase
LYYECIVVKKEIFSFCLEGIPMSIEQNKQIVRRFIEAANHSDTAILDELCTPSLAEGMKKGMAWVFATFGPDHHAEITDLIAEGDKVVARLATRGSHIGEWEGIPPTHKEWTNTGVYFVRLENNKIVEVDSLFDELGHIKQLGGTIQPPK